MSAPYSMRQFANVLADVAADTAMQPVLDGLERDYAKLMREFTDMDSDPYFNGGCFPDMRAELVWGMRS